MSVLLSPDCRAVWDPFPVVSCLTLCQLCTIYFSKIQAIQPDTTPAFVYLSNVTNVQLYKGKDENSSKDDGPLLKQSPDNKIALIIPPCFLSPIIRSRLKKSKWVSFYWSVMNDEEVENKNKLYLWVLTSLGRCFEFISRICFDLDNLKDTRESQHSGNVVKCWWFFILKWHVYRPSLDNKHQL